MWLGVYCFNFSYIHFLDFRSDNGCINKEIWMNIYHWSPKITVTMAKRSQRHPMQYEKYQSGCIWGFISIFDFRHGRSLLADSRHTSRQVVGRNLFDMKQERGRLFFFLSSNIILKIWQVLTTNNVTGCFLI